MALVAQERGRPLNVRERLNLLVRQGLFERLERRTLLRCPGRCFAVSSRLADDLARVHGVDRAALGVAPNGVDHSVFNPQARRFRAEVRREMGLGEKELVALFIGGIWWEKGLHVALRAVAQCALSWHLLVAGSDDDTQVFLRLAQDLGVSGQVHFLGRTDTPVRLYGAADCLILPSRFEGFPLVALEGAACGLPVLISQEGHPGDLVDGTTGFVLPRTPEAFAGALADLGTSRERLQTLGMLAAERARSFTWQRQAKILETAFLEYASRP